MRKLLLSAALMASLSSVAYAEPAGIKKGGKDLPTPTIKKLRPIIIIPKF